MIIGARGPERVIIGAGPRIQVRSHCSLTEPDDPAPSGDTPTELRLSRTAARAASGQR